MGNCCSHGLHESPRFQKYASAYSDRFSEVTKGESFDFRIDFCTFELREIQNEYQAQAEHELTSVRLSKASQEVAIGFLRRRMICEKVLIHIQNRLDALSGLSAQFKANKSSSEMIDSLDKFLVKINDEVESKFLKRPLSILQTNDTETEAIVALEKELGIDHCQAELANEFNKIINESAFEKTLNENTHVIVSVKN